MGAEQDNQHHAIDADPGAANCCHVDPAHAFSNAASVSIASDTGLRILSAVIPENDEIFWSSTSNTEALAVPTLDYAAGRGRTLYLTTLRLRI